jgi:hypothetical protein
MQYSFSKFFSMQVSFGCFLIKSREREKKASGDSSESSICGCGLPARCCQPAVAGSITYADLWGELSTHLALQALFIQSSPVCELLLQAFPFPSTLGEVTLHPLSQACMFIYSSCGKWVFPPLLRSFPPTTTFTTFPASDCWLVCLLTAHVGGWSSPLSCGVFLPVTLTSFPAPGCWACAPTPALSSQARLVYLQFWEGFSSPPFGAQGTSLSLLHVFIVLIITQFLFFPRVGVGLSRGLC